MVLATVEHHPIVLRSDKDWIVSSIAHRLSDHTIYLTPAYRDEVRRRLGPIFDEERATVIPNGVDVSRFPQYRVRPGDLQTVLVGMQGRMERAKDFATLIRAVARANLSGNRVFQLELVGDGPDRVGLEALAREVGPATSVRFAGRLGPDEVLERMAAWDIAVLSTRGETMSLTILETWALGVPLVSTRVGGVADLVVEDDDAILVGRGAADEMGQALVRLAQGPSLRNP